MALVCKDMRSMPYTQVSEKVITNIVDNINGDHHSKLSAPIMIY